MTNAPPQVSAYSLIPFAAILTFPSPSTTLPASYPGPDSSFSCQQTPLHRWCFGWPSPVEASVG